MCSTSSARLAAVCRAIEELADRSAVRSGATGEQPGENADDIPARLAAAWALIAAADPHVARRVAGYLQAAE